METPRLSDDFLHDLDDLSDSSADLPSVPAIELAPLQLHELDLALVSASSALYSATVNPALTASLPTLTSQIDQETVVLHHKAKEVYNKRFPELETQSQNPIEYCRLANAIRNESDVSKVDLTGIIANTKIIAIAISLSSTSGRLLTDTELTELSRICAQVESLTEKKSTLLQYLEMVVTTTAPNLCALLGTEVASKVLSACGGLKDMLNTPASTVQVLGQQRGPMFGLSATGAGVWNNYLSGSEIVRKAPESLRKKAIRMLAAKTVLAARVDYFKRSPAGDEGLKLKSNVLMRLEKATEGPPASAHRPLPVPEDRPRPHRGGQKVRAAKKKYQMTEIRKYANRVKMGVEAQEEFRDTGEGFGMLGVTGKLRIKAAAQPIGISAKKRRKMNAHNGGTESGLTSAFAFSQTQDLQLENPEKDVFAKPNSSYFAPTSGFATVLAEKMKAKK